MFMTGDGPPADMGGGGTPRPGRGPVPGSL